MTFKEIQELVAGINKSNISEFKLKDGEFELVIRTSKFTKGKTVYNTTAPMPAPMMAAAPAAAPTPAAAPVAAVPPAAALTAPVAAATPAASAESNYIAIKSPIVGTFYRSAGQDKPPFVKIGDKIEVGKVVCIVEAMKLFNEIESDIKGTVVKVMIEDKSPVEYDQVLFMIDPNG